MSADGIEVFPERRGPRDLHDALAILKPLGWEKSAALQPAIWMPVGKDSSRYILPDVPGSGVFVLRGAGLPVGGYRGTLEEVVMKAKGMS